jgi:hypothetical protein
LSVKWFKIDFLRTRRAGDAIGGADKLMDGCIGLNN